jgi:hypothetical protein
MAAGRPSAGATLGFVVKSGWAAVVLLEGPVSGPRVIDSRRIELSDPGVPGSRQPYHAGFVTARAQGAALEQLVESVQRFGRQSIARLITEYRAGSHRLTGAGMVVGSLIDPAGIANAHIRIHALEGQLFRGMVLAALGEHDLRCSVWRERDLHAAASAALERPGPQVRSMVAALGRTVTGPWRSEQKAAAAAAWLVLGR